MREEHATPKRGLADAIVRRPLASAAVIFMLGIFAHETLPILPLAYILTIPPVLLLMLFRRVIIAHCAIAASIFLAGLAAAQIESFCYPPNHIAHFTTDEPRLARVELLIETPPRLLTQTGPIPLPPRQVMQARVLRILTTKGWCEASGSTILAIHEPLPALAIRQRIIALGMLQRPMPATNPGQFDWADYYRRQRILTSIHVPHAANVQILSSPGPTLLDRLRLHVRYLLHLGFADNRSLDHALLRALVVGDPDPQLRDVQDEFIRTGTSHHLAISGMHVAVLGAVVYGICRLLRLGPRRSTSIGLTFAVLYGFVALPSPPVVRSVLLCAAFAAGILFRRSVDGVQLLSLSVIAMLIYHPLDLYDAGFQLSFGTVLGLMIFSGPAMRFFDSLRDRDLVIALELQPPRGWRRFHLWFRKTTLAILIPSVVAWLVAAPLVSFHFNQLNPWATLASIILAFPVFLSLIGGFAKVFLTLLLPSLAPLAAAIAAWPIALMRTWLIWLGKLPGSNLALPRPSIWLLVLYYILLVAPLFPWKLGRWRWARWALRAAPALGLFLLIFSLIAQAAFGPKTTGRLRLAVLSVGAGQCAAVHLPSGKMIIFDAGSDSLSDAARNCLIPYLKSAGASSIDRIFISHANQDHFNAVAETARQFAPRELCVSSLFNIHSGASTAGRDLIQAIQEQDLRMNPLMPADRIALDGSTELQVLWPPFDRALDPNDASLVLKLTCDGRSILFTGDIQQTAQETLLRTPKALKADILIAPHHGSSEETTARFLAAVDPSIIICSNGRKLSRKQREFDQLAAKRRVYRTHLCGAIVVDVTQRGAIDVSPFAARRELISLPSARATSGSNSPPIAPR